MGRVPRRRRVLAVPSILLVRHGQASFGGADYDVLSELGHRQAAATAEELVRRGVRASRVVAGRLARQRDTAVVIAERLGAESFAVDPRWDEYATADVLGHHSSTGVREDRPPGSDAPPISSRDFQELLEAALRRWIAAGDGSPAAETWPRFAARTHAALGDVAAELGPGEVGVACTSGGVIAAICAAALGAPPDPAFIAANRVTINAGITKLAVGRSGTTLVAFNDHAHLEGAEGLLTYR